MKTWQRPSIYIWQIISTIQLIKNNNQPYTTTSPTQPGNIQERPNKQIMSNTTRNNTEKAKQTDNAKLSTPTTPQKSKHAINAVHLNTNICKTRIRNKTRWILSSQIDKKKLTLSQKQT